MSPNNQPWLRKYDALIAERAEGLKVFQCEAGAWWVHAATGHRPLDHYNEDLAASARAQEAWRLQKPKKRWYSHTSPSHVELSGNHWSICVEGRDTVGRGGDSTESAARAWALWRACGGAE